MTMQLKTMKAAVDRVLTGSTQDASKVAVAKQQIESKVSQELEKHLERVAQPPPGAANGYPVSDKTPYHLNVDEYVKASFEDANAALAQIAKELSAQGATDIAFHADYPFDHSSLCSFSLSFNIEGVK